MIEFILPYPAVPDLAGLPVNIALCEDVLLVHWSRIDTGPNAGFHRYRAFNRQTGEPMPGGQGHRRLLPDRSVGVLTSYGGTTPVSRRRIILDGVYRFHLAVSPVVFRCGKDRRRLALKAVHRWDKPEYACHDAHWTGHTRKDSREPEGKVLFCIGAGHRFMVAGGPDGDLLLVENDEDGIRGSFSRFGQNGHDTGIWLQESGTVHAIAGCPEREWLAVGFADRTEIRHWRTGQVLQSFACPANLLSFAPDGLTLAIGVVCCGTEWIRAGRVLANNITCRIVDLC